MDYRRLQEDLRDCFGSAMLSGFPMAAIGTISVDCASESELLKLAKHAGLNLRKYEDWCCGIVDKFVLIKNVKIGGREWT